jgi:uncharacterized protein with GYD domain
VAGVGTGGTIMGTGRYLREMKPDIKLYPLEPSNSPTMSTGYKVGFHRIQGISDEFIPALVKLDMLNEVISVDDGDSIIMAQKLANELGLTVGISSGANFLGALKKLEELGGDKIVVTVFSDDNKKYLSTGLMKKEPVKDDFLSPHVQLKSFRAFRRSCMTCCNPEECEAVTNKEILKEINKEVEFMGAKILTQYALLGQYDFVNILEAPSNEAIAKLAIRLSARGTMQTLTLTAITLDHLISTLKERENPW